MDYMTGVRKIGLKERGFQCKTISSTKSILNT